MRRLRPDEKLVALWLVYGVVFIDMIGVTNLLPVLPFIVGAKSHPDGFTKDQLYGMSPGAASSLVLSTFNFAQLFSTVIMGKLSDRLGRKPLLLASLIGGVVGYGLQGLGILISNWTLLIAARVLTGLFGGSRPVVIAYIADWSTPQNRAKLLGLLAVVTSFAIQIGAVLGGSLGSVNLSLPAFFAAGASLAGTPVSWYFIQEMKQADTPAGDPTSAKSEEKGTQRGLLAAFLLIDVLSFVCGMFVNGISTAIALLLPAVYDFTPNEVGLVVFGAAIVVLLSNPVYLQLLKRARVPAIAAFGCLAMTAAIPVPFFSHSAGAIALYYVCVVGPSLAMPATSAMVTTVAPPPKRGAWTGICLAIQALGRTLGPIIVGVAWDVDIKSPFVIMGAFSLLGCVVSLLLVPRLPFVSSDQKKITQKQEQATSNEQSEATVGQLPSGEDSDLVQRLRSKQTEMQDLVRELEAGVVLSQHAPWQLAEKRDGAKVELSDWLVTMLESNGYQAWSEHLDGIKLMLYNAFPPIHSDSRVTKLKKLIQLVDHHVSVAESRRSSDLFDDAEDLKLVF